MRWFGNATHLEGSRYEPLQAVMAKVQPCRGPVTQVMRPRQGPRQATNSRGSVKSYGNHFNHGKCSFVHMKGLKTTSYYAQCRAEDTVDKFMGCSTLDL